MANVNVQMDREIRTVISMEGLDHIVVGDAPKQIGGLGEHLSPTDLFSGSLGSCMLTMMGLKAKQLGVDLVGSSASVAKKMISDPLLRISGFTVVITVPRSFDPEIQKQLEEAAVHCPIHLSLSDKVHQDISFQWQ